MKADFLGVIYFWGLGGRERPGGLIFIVVSVSFNFVRRPHFHVIHKHKQLEPPNIFLNK